MQCQYTFKLRNKKTGFHSHPIRCGQCTYCRRRKASEWVTRLKHEHAVSKTAWFITLTYEESNVPIATINGEHVRVLNKRHVQLFFKKLLKKQDKLYPNFSKIRRYYVGEYGGKYMRPHYHLIVFGMHRDLRKYLPELWQYGQQIQCGKLNDGGVAYTTLYSFKKEHMPQCIVDLKETDYELYKKYRPFTHMSNRQGIGHQYIEDNFEFHQKQQKLYISDKGHKRIMPKFYKDRLFTSDQLEVMNKQSLAFAQEKLRSEIARLRQLGYEDPEAELKLRQLTEEEQYRTKIYKKDGNFQSSGNAEATT